MLFQVLYLNEMLILILHHFQVMEIHLIHLNIMQFLIIQYIFAINTFLFLIIMNFELVIVF
jgi:hypothetical protein